MTYFTFLVVAFQQENQDYRNFRYFQCIDKYAILFEVLEGETATGNQAQASSVPPSILNPRKRAGHTGGQIFSSQFGDEVYNAGQDVDFNKEAPSVGVK